MTSTNHTTFAKDKLARSFKSLGAITGAITLLALILITVRVIAQGTVIDPAAGEETMRVIGALEEGELGSAVASGDVNGDGYDDLVVAAPYATIVSGTEIYTGSGAVYLILGRPNISSTWDLSTTTPNILFYGECFPDFVCPEWVGSDVSVSDVNGDELDDIIIGTEKYSGEPGAAFVFVGRSTLTTADYFVVNIKAQASATELGYNLKIASPTPYDRLGHSTATGDLNNDGYDDLIMGAHRANPDASGSIYPPDYQDYQYAAPVTRTRAGAVYVTLGKSDLISSRGEYQDLQICLQSYTVYGKDDYDFLGHSVASGDVNGDGYTDIIAAAYGGDGADSGDAIIDSGEVYVFWGSDAITYPIPSACPADVYTSHIIVDLAYTSTVHTDGITIGHTSDITIYGASAYDWAGWDVSSADLNGDGYDDIIIGAPGDTQGHSGRYGQVYVIYGEMTPNPTIYLSETADLTIVGAELDDRTGESVSAADLNQDGYDDLIVGAIQADHDGRSNAGKAYVFYGTGGGGLTGTIYLSETDAAHITFLGENSDDGVGKGLGAGDLNHDNVLDLLVGAPGFDANGGSDEGILYTLAGDAVRGVTLTGELPTVVAGQAATYTLAAWNRYADWDVTPFSTFSLEAGANGGCTGNLCTPTRIGVWSVSGEYGALSDATPLTVTPAELHQVTISPPSVVLDPGAQQQFTAQGYDVYDNAIEGLAYNWSVLDSDAGTINTAGLFTADQTGVYTDTVLVSANTFTDAATIIVSNLAPHAIISGAPLSGFEGSPVNFDGSPSYDLGGSITSYAWDWDYDGSFATDAPGVTATHQWPDNGNFNVALRVVDNDETSSTTTTWVTVANVPPTVVLGGPYGTSLAQTVTITSSVFDPGDDVLTYAWDLDNDGASDDGSAPTAVFTPTAAGVFTVSLRVNDDDGGVGYDETLIVVGNLTPTAVISGTPLSGFEGTPITLDGSASFDLADSLVYAWDWDYHGTFVTDDLGITSTTAYSDDGLYIVALRVTDTQGASDTTTETVTIANVAPTITLGGPYTTLPKQTVIITSSVFDPGDDVLTYAWDLDDDGDFDDASTPTVVFSRTVTGLFTVTLQVTDDDGGVGSAYTTVQVTPYEVFLPVVARDH